MDSMDHFMGAISSMMSNLLRSCVYNSMEDLCQLLEEYHHGNDYQGTYSTLAGLGLPVKVHPVKFFMVRSKVMVKSI